MLLCVPQVALKGNIEIKSRGEIQAHQSRTVLLRRVLDLYVYVMEARSLPGTASCHGPPRPAKAHPALRWAMAGLQP